MSSRNKLFPKASVTFKCSEEEELLAQSVSLLNMSERVSWDPGPDELFMICSEERELLFPQKRLNS